MSLPPAEYANFLMATAGICLFLGLIIGFMLGMQENGDGCQICAGIVNEHLRAMRSTRRIRGAAAQAERDLHEEFDLNANDGEPDWEFHDWDGTYAR